MSIKSMVDEVFAIDNGAEVPEILYVSCDMIQQDIYIVGIDGVTKIDLYHENGQMGYVPWLAIYKGDFLYARMDASHMRIVYKEASK